MPTTLKRDSLLSFANSHREEFEALLKRFVETPTVSVDPNHARRHKKRRRAHGRDNRRLRRQSRDLPR